MKTKIEIRKTDIINTAFTIMAGGIHAYLAACASLGAPVRGITVTTPRRAGEPTTIRVTFKKGKK